MAKNSTLFVCNGCGAETLRWVGKCGRCGEFGTVAERESAPVNTGHKSSLAGEKPSRPARPIQTVSTEARPRLTTGIGELDRVLGGGLVAGQVVLCSGPPGSGKSTLMLQAAQAIAKRSGKPALYISGEESAEQIALRARRIGADDPNLLVADETDLSRLLGHIEATPNACFVVVDSIQTIASASVDGRMGGIAQVMEVTHALTRIAKTKQLPLALIGQVTKDSNVAGPRALEHVVDTTLALDGEQHSTLRLLRTVKNRFGSLEVGAFEHDEGGLQEVSDPSGLFHEDRSEAVPGTCLTMTTEGTRCLLAEVQSLVCPTNSPNPRRGVSGLDPSRVAMLTAVTEKAAGIKLFEKDVFSASVGGIRIHEPGADLAICLAIVSSSLDVPIPTNTVAFGEVTLSGDLRPVRGTAARAREAIRLGAQQVITPTITRADTGGSPKVAPQTTLSQAIRACLRTISLPA